jgi:ribosomal protein S18 acetylase RimI-like enzyme
VTTTALSFTTHDDVPHDDALVVDAGLGAANDAAAPLHEVRALACFARGPGGAVVGGAVGRTWGRCAELQQLWVDAAHRRQGIGTRLVRDFETRAEARGCDTFYLETFSFQAPSLYAALGYRVALEIEGYGAGIRKFTMVRTAAAGPDRAAQVVENVSPSRGAS